MTASPPTARGVAAERIEQWLARGDFADTLLQGIQRDRAFITEVVYGTLRWHRALDYVRACLAPQAPRPEVAAPLLAAIYELLFMDHSEAYAVVDQTVSVVRARGGPRPAGFINAVLRKVCADREGWRRRIASQPPGVRWSHPDLLVARWRARLGEAGLEALCRWNNERPDVVLRIETGRVPLADYRARLDQEQIRHEPHPARPDECLRLLQAGAPERLPGYAEGWFAVQDPSTLAAVDLVDPQPGERLLDACAAPGGKTMALAARLRGEGRLLALDVEPHRLQRVTENAARLGRPDVETRLMDLTAGPQAFGGETFDAVLLDVPCTNTGVLRRRPDARWRFDEARLANALALQRRLLDAAAPLVKPGGRLVYSTCSVEREENQEQVARWLKEHPGFALEQERESIPPAHRTDGAYAARLRRA